MLDKGKPLPRRVGRRRRPQKVSKIQFMSDEPKRRPVLSLKNPPKVTLPEGLRPREPVPPPAPQHDWKCKPCGAGFSIEASLAPEVVIRCPACNAKLGAVGDFRTEPLPTKVRARPVKKH